MEKFIVSEVDYNEMNSKLDEIAIQLSEINKQNVMKETWLDNQDVCLLLKVSTRTLQNYRDKGILPFSQIGNKIYYKLSDIEIHLEKNYINAGSGFIR